MHDEYAGRIQCGGLPLRSLDGTADLPDQYGCSRSATGLLADQRSDQGSGWLPSVAAELRDRLELLLPDGSPAPGWQTPGVVQARQLARVSIEPAATACCWHGADIACQA